MPSPRTSTPSTATGTDALLYLLFGAVGAALVYGSLAWLSGDTANWLFGHGRWAPFNPTGAITHPAQLWPGLGPTALLVAARVVPAVITAALAAAGVAGWLRLRGPRTGLARRAELAPLLDKEATAKARSLRPTLNGRECKRGRAR
ncbi:hypothetical protein GXW83_28290 [Streptacidiphilus sp. PB12-B1b]|nr:hypothetical protein GXW83_28290 [Streptacidiphilus sp. PB12-B1b]